MAEENTGTIDYSIDLGTTTSSIAKVDGNGTMVIPNTLDNKNFVSSAVYIKKNGTIFVGDKAKKKIATDPKNGYAEFKLKMGSDYIYDFEATGKQMTPVELSAEILKNLRQTVMEKHQKDLKAAVITVPADFTAPQTKATTEAAKLAGFEKVILLQEPTAAAMAYGFGSSDDNEVWLIYDLGGGTFDVSVMKKNSEEIVNINNQGDAYLGGKLIDWDIVDKIFVPAVVEETGLTDFNRDNPKYIKPFAKLKDAAENAKADLSNFDVAEIDIENLVLASDGDFFDFEYEMTRDELAGVMKQYVDRTINHCHKALEEVNLSVSDVTKIILVGGSTLSPYIHERLEEEFHIPLEFSIDPTTVVARGAAIFASTKTFVDTQGPSSGFVSVEVKYNTMGDDDEFTVNGKVVNPDGSSDGYSVEFVNNKTGYSSGKVPVGTNGMFRTSLFAEDEEDYNIFEIKVYDASGSLATLAPNSINTIKYIIDIPPSEHILSHSLGLGLYGNELDVLAKKGTPLPFELERTYSSSNYVHKGNASEKVDMPLYEGNKMKADRNTLIGSLTITGADIDRDLPEGSEIELTVTIDESMNIDGTVYIGFLDKEIEGGFAITKSQFSKDDLEMKFDSQKERYNNYLMKYSTVNNPQITNFFNQIDDENIIENIENFLKTSETDVDALDKASKRINDFTDILDRIDAIGSRLSSWDELKEETDTLLRGVEENIDKAEPQIQRLFAQLKERYQSAVETKNEKLLIDVRDKLQFIFMQLHELEMVTFGFLEISATGEFIDQAAADRLISQGNDALGRGDIQELKRILGQLVKILKQDAPSQGSGGGSTPTQTDWGVRKE